MRVRAAAAVLLCSLGCVAVASAHEEVPGVVNVIEGIDPALPGVTIQVRISAADQLLVGNTTPTELVVIGEEDEPFLRIGPDGALGNLRSPTWYRSNDPTGAIPPPPSADASAAPEWALVSREPAWGWFDHRLHRVQLTAAPPGRRPVVLERWTVPMRYGDRDVVVRGRREYRPVRGAFQSVVTKQLPGAEATILPGRLPGIFLRVTGETTVTLFGERNEPFARVGPEGAEVNERSPTWALTVSVRSGQVPPDEGGTGERWRRVDGAPQLAWLEPRARYPAPEPPERIAGAGETTVVQRWAVPARVDGEQHLLEGETSWVPAAHAERGEGSGWVLPSTLAGAAAATALGVAVLRRRVRA